MGIEKLLQRVFLNAPTRHDYVFSDFLRDRQDKNGR